MASSGPDARQPADPQVRSRGNSTYTIIFHMERAAAMALSSPGPFSERASRTSRGLLMLSTRNFPRSRRPVEMAHRCRKPGCTGRTGISRARDGQGCPKGLLGLVNILPSFIPVLPVDRGPPALGPVSGKPVGGSQPLLQDLAACRTRCAHWGTGLLLFLPLGDGSPWPPPVYPPSPLFFGLEGEKPFPVRLIDAGRQGLTLTGSISRSGLPCTPAPRRPFTACGLAGHGTLPSPSGNGLGLGFIS